MTDIHAVDAENRHLYECILRPFYAMRHDVFVDERGWSNIERDDGLDIDVYDDMDAVYLLAIDRNRIVGGQRLYPAQGPHMLRDIFPSFVDDQNYLCVPTMEWTRYFVARERRFGRTDCRMLAAVQRYCLEAGVQRLVALVETWWLYRWQQAGFEVKPLGLPQLLDGRPCIAASVAVSKASLNNVSHFGGLRGDTGILRCGLTQEMVFEPPGAPAMQSAVLTSRTSVEHPYYCQGA